MLKVLKSGLLTTIQDLGRFGYQRYGVIVSGAMDPLSHRIANILVGNEEHFPSIEVTLIGPIIQFHKSALIAICGGDLSAKINGEPIRMWRPIYVKKNSILSFGACRSGCRTYISVAGGFHLPKVMGSYSTYLRAGLGGYKGRPLQAGDEVEFCSTDLGRKMYKWVQKENEAFSETNWAVSADFIPSKNGIVSLRIMRGRESSLYPEQMFKRFLLTHFTVLPQSDRMGYRLDGALKMSLKNQQNMISEAVNFGTIQVPPDGNPIILMADRQTTGGYPKIAQVITADFQKLAQVKPGDIIQFKEVSHEKAQILYLEREYTLQLLKNGIYLKSQ